MSIEDIIGNQYIKARIQNRYSMRTGFMSLGNGLHIIKTLSDNKLIDGFSKAALAIGQQLADVAKEREEISRACPHCSKLIAFAGDGPTDKEAAEEAKKAAAPKDNELGRELASALEKALNSMLKGG